MRSKLASAVAGLILVGSASAASASTVIITFTNNALPTLAPWALALLAVGLGVLALAVIRRKAAPRLLMLAVSLLAGAGVVLMARPASANIVTIDLTGNPLSEPLSSSLIFPAQDFTFRNPGAEPLTITGVIVTNDGTDDWGANTGSCVYGQVLNTGDTCTVHLPSLNQGP